MKITKINLFQCNTPFKFSFHSPHVYRIQADSIVVELQFNNGISGYGESAPRPYVTGETCSTVRETIQYQFSKTLFSREINSLEDVERTLNTLEKEIIANKATAYNSALSAVDIALLDALGKYQNLPLHSYLGPIVGNKMSTSLSIPFLNNMIMKELYHRFKKLNFDSIKIIMGKVENDNIERVKFIRSLFGEDKEIRIEANGKWSIAEAISIIEKLKIFNISGVEQPVARSDIEGLQEIRKKTGIPVIVDESMYSLSDAKDLIEKGACDIINIKISKCGGLLRSKQIRDLAQSRNIRCQVGEHVGETSILSKAGQYFAMTTQNLFCFEGFSYLLFEKSSKDKFKKQSRKKDTFTKPGLDAELTNQTLKPICSIENKCV